MFAGSMQSIVCHLIEEHSGTTLCGLRVSRYVRSRRSGSRLHLLNSKPDDCRVCKHCQRMGDEGLDTRAQHDEVIQTAVLNLSLSTLLTHGSADQVKTRTASR
jgi:wyosine [tRNA(Phe)-imidazoG37] synthetase (radical SAM superfamily)